MHATVGSKHGRTTANAWQRMVARLGWLEPYLWTLPAVLFFSLLVAYPVFFSYRLGFSKWSGLTPIANIEWTGLENYRRLFLQDKVFRLVLANTAVYALVTTVVYGVLGFLLAFALWYRAPRVAGYLRSLIFYPTILSTVVIALAWSNMYAMDGLINSILSAILGRPIEIMWLSNTKLALYSVMWMDIWQYAGWCMVLYLAGMSSISRELLDSALVEGANTFQLARYIVEPLVRGVTGLCVLLNIIGGFKVFGAVWMLTRGGPLHRSEVLATYSYWLSFDRFGPLQVGYAGAVTSVGVMILFVLSFIRLRAVRIGI